ncbi:MAG: hypothetical protein LLF99_09260 [Desulfobacteraceae bacterium]|nr:hypothetical protein [Desulfobacteraceae bacterium]
MLKIIKLVSLYFLALAVSESTPLNAPPYLLQGEGAVHRVTVTAYTNHPKCTGSKTGAMACARRIKPRDYSKIVALSRDIAHQYEFGDDFNLWVKGRMYKVSYQDRMPKKHKSMVDLLLPSLKSCRQFGRQPGILVQLEKA